MVTHVSIEVLPSLTDHVSTLSGVKHPLSFGRDDVSRLLLSQTDGKLLSLAHWVLLVGYKSQDMIRWVS